MCDLWQNLAGVADELCFYRGCQVESVNHPTANYHVNTGNRFGGDPSIGAWVNYGLGTENEDLPGFIVLPELAYPQGGAANWSNGYLPTALQGTPLRPKGSPILDIAPPAGITREHQRRNLDFLQKLNQRHAALHPQHDDLAARMQNYELAFRMQMQVPEMLSIDDESQQTLDDVRRRRASRRTTLAADACWPGNWSKRACVLCKSTPAPGIRMTTSPRPMER